MNIVVFGATGDTGVQIVRQGLERGHRILAFVRDPARLSLKHERLSVHTGNVLEPDSMRGLFEDHRFAISALGVRFGQPVDETRSRGTRNIVHALAEQGVKRFVSVSTIGVGDSLERADLFGRLLLPRVIGDKRLEEARIQEDILRTSTLEWTILRPPRLTNDAPKRPYTIGSNLRSRFTSTLSRANLARAALDELEAKRYVHQAPSVLE
jgi:putative NADH-flavin reductase